VIDCSQVQYWVNGGYGKECYKKRRAVLVSLKSSTRTKRFAGIKDQDYWISEYWLLIADKVAVDKQ
jgi:hypothetical protein